MQVQTFQQRFCAHLNCPESQYAARAFWALLYTHAKVIAPPIRWLKPAFFEPDFRFIHDLGQAIDLREAETSAADFQDSNAGRRGWRTRMKIRVSGLKASRLARELFAD